MHTNLNEQLTLGTHAERMVTDPSDFPNGHVWFETDTKLSAIAFAGSWQPFAPGVLAAAAFGHATILAGQDHVDVPITGLTSAAEVLVSIVGAAVDVSCHGVQGSPSTGSLRILSTTGVATANTKVSYLIPSVV